MLPINCGLAYRSTWSFPEVAQPEVNVDTKPRNGGHLLGVHQEVNYKYESDRKVTVSSSHPTDDTLDLISVSTFVAISGILHIMTISTALKNVIVVGGSYVGQSAAQQIAAILPVTHRVLLIEPHSHFHFLFVFVSTSQWSIGLHFHSRVDL